jgi:hypothetical protein
VLDDLDWRSLWSQVVLQARDDVETADFGSVDYEQATDFFVGSGRWAESRAAIAELVDLHPDDLVRLGRGLINRRRDQAGLPAMDFNRRRPPGTRPPPVLVAIVVPVAPAAPHARHRPYGRPAGWISPFSPFRPIV